MTRRTYRLEIVMLVAVIAFGMLGVGVSVGFGLSQRASTKRDHTIIVGINDGGVSQKLQAAHSDCRGTRASILDAARWHILFSLPDQPNAAQVKAAKEGGLNLPTIDQFTNHGGAIDGKAYGACPPSIAVHHPHSPTSTTRTITRH